MSRSNMDNTQRESSEYQCKKLGGIAHVNAEYFGKTKGKLLIGFSCDRAGDCGIIRSPFSNSPNFTIDCPVYITLENNF